MSLPFFTIGHSSRSVETFIAMLRRPRVQHIVDIRKIPRSASNPQFDADRLREDLGAAGVSYEHLAALGGLRGKAAGVSPAVNGYWSNASFHNYADYALSGRFRDGFRRLLGEGRRQRCAIMCSEAVWWRCHRRIVADYLLAEGEAVFHIMSETRLEPAKLTPGAVVQPDGTILYPAATGLS